MYIAKIFIKLKSTVNDPQGQTIHGGLTQLGFDSVKSVRAGKYLEVRLDEASEDEAKLLVIDMCDKLLANPIIEDYIFDIESVHVT